MQHFQGPKGAARDGAEAGLAATTQPGRALPSAVLDRFLDRLDPHLPEPNPALRNTQLICGRWLALHRLRLRLTAEMIAELTSVPAEVLLLLEAGLADVDLVPQEAWGRLQVMLASDLEDIPTTATAMALALGQAETPGTLVMEQIIAELEAIDAGEAAPAPAAPVETAAPQQTLTGGVMEASAPESKPQSPLHPDVYDILEALSLRARHSYGILREIAAFHRQDELRIDLATIAGLIMRMLADGWITEEGERVDTRLDNQPRHYYELSPLGRQKLEAERARLKQIERETGLKSTGLETGPEAIST